MLNTSALKLANDCAPLYPFRYWCLPDKDKEATDKETESPTLPEDKPEDNGLGDNTSEGLNNFSLSPTDIEANVTVNITTNIIYIEETEPNAVYEESPLESMPVEAPMVSEAA